MYGKTHYVSDTTGTLILFMKKFTCLHHNILVMDHVVEVTITYG